MGRQSETLESHFISFKKVVSDYTPMTLLTTHESWHRCKNTYHFHVLLLFNFNLLFMFNNELVFSVVYCVKQLK